MKNQILHVAALRFATMLFSVIVFAAAANAATLTVTNTNDSGTGSLRRAIADAASGDTIDFDAAVFSTAQTISLTSGLLFVDKSLTINGTGADKLTISGDNTARVFYMMPLTSVSLKGMKITGGDGGITTAGWLTVSNCTISGNSTINSGGGIDSFGAAGTSLTIINSTISDNSAGAFGGGIVNFVGTLVIVNSTISGNSAGLNGGGIASAGGPVHVTHSTITGNRADSNGDGLGGGGGISSPTNNFVRNSIVAGNLAGTGLAPFDLFGDFAETDYSLIGNAATAGGLMHGVDGNIVGDNGSGTLAINTVLSSTVQFNGGSTRTHALISGSPAINAGGAIDLTTDQRGTGFPRMVGTAPDMGAYEFQDNDGDGNEDPCLGGGKVAFTSDRDGNTGIYLMNMYGSGVTGITDHATHDSFPAFSPDGTKIAYTSWQGGSQEIRLMNADGSGAITLTNSPGHDARPAFSPDGTKIAFTSERTGDLEVFVMNADGTGQVNISNFPGAADHGPAFSPDGSKIAYTSLRDGNPEVYVANVDGTDATNLTMNSTSDGDPAFSPDGSKILFGSFRNGSNEIHIMNADGSNPVNLTNHPGNDLQPAFSPDGTKVLFTSGRDGNSEIYIMNLDGSGQTNLTNETSNDVDGASTASGCDAPPVPVSSTVMDKPADTQYSDVVTLRSTTTAAGGTPVTTGTVEFVINGVSVGTANVDPNGVATIITQILLPAGSYTVSATYAANDSYQSSSDSDSLTVTREDAVVTPASDNVVSVKVNTPGGSAGPVVLCADVAEVADGSLGDIALAVPVTFALVPVAPGSALQQQDTSLSGGRACVTFNNVPVNVYDVTITVGGNYYAGSASTVLAVFDPSLGFTTGGGRVVNPQTGNTLHFGFSFKYDKKGFKGQMLVIEHTPEGEVKLKSNALSSLSIVGNSAIVIGKASILDGLGNLGFRLYVTDSGEPGSADLFGLKLNSASGTPIPAFTIDPQRTIIGGNIQVPQGVKK